MQGPPFMHRMYLLPFVSMAVLGMGAGSSSHTVRQNGRKFSVQEITVGREEPVVFVNDDTVPHNVMSTSQDNAFDLGAQAPGTETPVRFTIAGTVVVVCAIHPRMRMTITVTDP
jgi:plastocyanin